MTLKEKLEAFDTRGHFMRCKWKPVKLIGKTAWGYYLVEFEDGHRDYKLNLRGLSYDA